MSNKLHVFDTTLRDGEQAGHKMSRLKKVAVAHALADAGIDVIEAGFPVSSDGDAGAVEDIAREVRGSVICALARTKDADVDAALRAIEGASRPRLHTFVSTSDVHVEHKLRMTREAVIDMAVRAIRRARQHCDDVEFSPEDAARTSPEYLAAITNAAIDAGATVINIPDTVGYSILDQFGEVLTYLKEHAPRLWTDVTLSVHCHNDLGCAVHNTLLGVSMGARQIEGCMLGIGERAGNVQLEAVIMAIKTHPELFPVSMNVDTRKLGPLARTIARYLDHYEIPQHHPIVGSRAFSHSSGVHADGMIKDRRTYEIMTPGDVGWEGSAVELTSHMGRNGLAQYLTQLGYDGAALTDDVYSRLIALSDIKGVLSDEDVHMFVQEVRQEREAHASHLFMVRDHDIDYQSGASATVTIRRDERVVEERGTGDGPVSAVMRAINFALLSLGLDPTTLLLDDYTVIKGQGGPEANAWVVIRVSSEDGSVGYGRAMGTDTVRASAHAYLNAINHLLMVPVFRPE